MAHAGCVEDHTSRESAPTWEKVDRRIRSPRRGRRGDQEVFQDPLQHNGTLGFPSHTKEKARESAKVKEKEEKATKEKEKDNCLDLVSIQLGDRHLATCRIGTRTVTRQSWSHYAQRCGMFPTRTSNAGKWCKAEKRPTYCIPKVVRMETGEVIYEKVYSSPRPPQKISLRSDWMKELGSEVARQPEGEVARQAKSFQSTQPNPNPNHDRTGRPVVCSQRASHPRFSRDSTNFNLEEETNHDRTGRPVVCSQDER